MKIKEQLAKLTKTPPPVRLIYELHDGLVVVPEPDGCKRVVVLDQTLQQKICKYFHDEGGHLGVHRVLMLLLCFSFGLILVDQFAPTSPHVTFANKQRLQLSFQQGSQNHLCCHKNQEHIGHWTFWSCPLQPMDSDVC